MPQTEIIEHFQNFIREAVEIKRIGLVPLQTKRGQQWQEPQSDILRRRMDEMRSNFNSRINHVIGHHEEVDPEVLRKELSDIASNAINDFGTRFL